MKKTKLTLQQKLLKRKYHIPNRACHFIYRTIMSKMVAPKYKPHYTIIDDINECKGPCFLIWNHLSRLDHAFVMEAAYPRRISILAGYNEFFRSHLQLPFRLMNIIPKKIFTNDMAGTRAMSSIIRQGGCVCFSPEGMSSIYGTNQPIVVGTGHFIKHYKIPVYFLKLKGQYLTNTKVCLDERYGRTEAELSLLFTPEDLKILSPQEIEDKINEVFRHDDYKWNKEQRIAWKTNGNICDHLSDICYYCPRCHQELVMKDEKDHIVCTNCGNGAHMNEYYDFVLDNDDCIIPDTPSDWVALERIKTIKEIRENSNYQFTEHVKLGYLPPDKFLKHKKTTEICGEGDITVDHEGIHYQGTKLGQPWNFDLSYQTVFSLVIVTNTSYFGLYINEEYHEFFPDRASVGKLLLLVEEMHRLHVNTWKNFPWNYYMYETVKEEGKTND